MFINDAIFQLLHYYKGEVMINILKIASAFIGAVLGAGFSSGQEVLQYFTSHGINGVWGALVVAVFFGIMGMLLVRIGFRLQATSHQEVIQQITGPFLSKVFDIILMLTLFGIGVVMLAGAGPIFNQQFGIPTYIGTLLMTLLVLLTIMIGVEKIVRVIAFITPVFLLIIIFINIYSAVPIKISFENLEAMAVQQNSISGNWFFSAVNYLSVITLTNAAMLFIMGGNESKEKHALFGGLLGGFFCGLLVLISTLALYANIDVVAGVQIPTLVLANQMSPLFGLIFSISLFGMIYSTAVSLFFSFNSRFFEPRTKKFNSFSVITLVVAFSLGLYGFSDLVSIVFPLVGYMGMAFIVIIIIASLKLNQTIKAMSSSSQNEASL